LAVKQENVLKRRVLLSIMPNAQPVRVAIDIETTGLQVESESIIEIGAIRFQGSDILDTFQVMIDPHRPIPYRIQRLTNITPAMLVGAPQFSEIAPKLRTFLSDIPLVGHSVGFDAAFLRKMHIAERNALIDTFELASLLLPSLASYSLESVASHLNLSASEHHRALADAILARDVLLELEKQIAALPDPLLNSLCALSHPSLSPVMAILHQEQRRRGNQNKGSSISNLGTMGSAFSAQMGTQLAVLGTKVAKLPAPTPQIMAVDQITETSPANIPEIAQLVTQTFEQNLHSLVEISPDETGIDAIMRPVLERTLSHHEQLVIAVASLSQVRALIQHHIPRVLGQISPQLSSSVPIAPLFESHDYLCLHRWYGPGRENAVLSPDGLRGMAKLTLWIHDTSDGVRDEVTLNPREQIAWELTRAGEEFISLPNCAYRDRGWCFSVRARKATETAKIVVTTHAALLGRNLTRGDTNHSSSYVPPADAYLLLDANHLEERIIAQATRTLDAEALDATLLLLWNHSGQQITGLFAHAHQSLPGEGGENWGNQVTRAREAMDTFFTCLASLLADPHPTTGGSSENQTTSMRIDSSARSLPSWGALADAWTIFSRRINTLAESSSQASRLLGNKRGMEAMALELSAQSQKLKQFSRIGNDVFAQSQTDQVAWIRPPILFNRPGQGRTRPGTVGSSTNSYEEYPSLHIASSQVTRLIERAIKNLGKGVILAGTTITVDNSFDYTCERLGLSLPCPTATVPNNRQEQTIILIPSEAPEPNMQTYQRSLNETIIQTVTTLQGRTIILFPSHTTMRATYNAIKQSLEAKDILAMAQGIDGSQRQLWQNYRSQERVVLFGAGGIWDGLDSDIAHPSCIFIARLPLAALNDPLLAARAEGLTNQMNQFIVPHTALRIRQMLNRLAWSTNERNVIIFYDRRVVTKEYGATLLHTLPLVSQHEVNSAAIGDVALDWLNREI
jgi:ATP-dependent DNA helicase DinG